MIRLPHWQPPSIHWRTLCCGLLLYWLQTSAWAQPPAHCQCVWQGSFVDAFRNADVVITGSVVSARGNSADLAIQQKLRDPDNVLPGYVERIRLWGDNGNLCRPAIEQFATDTQWVLALKKITEVPRGGFNPATPSISFGREGDYYLSACGANWLRLQDDFVTGNLVGGRRWSWENDQANPVLLKLVQAYLDGTLPREALVEAAKPPSELKKLMDQTRDFLRQQ